MHLRASQFGIRHVVVATLVVALLAWIVAPGVRGITAERLPTVIIRATTAGLFCLAFLSWMWRSRRRAERKAGPLRWSLPVQLPTEQRWLALGGYLFLGFYLLVAIGGIVGEVGETNWLERIWATILCSAYFSTCVGIYVGQFIGPRNHVLVGEGGVVLGLDFLSWDQLDFPRKQPAEPNWLTLNTVSRTYLLDARREDVEEIADFLNQRCRLWAPN